MGDNGGRITTQVPPDRTTDSGSRRRIRVTAKDLGHSSSGRLVDTPVEWTGDDESLRVDL